MFAVSATILISATASAAENSDFGLGIILGEPTGISGKLWTGGNSAVDGAVAWSMHNSASLHLHADYLVHSFSSRSVEKGRLPIYYGVGGRIKFSENNNDNFIGVRAPVGIEYLFETAPVDIFFEIVPILNLAPDTDFDLNAAVGARYFF
ncbi:MAG: hypothetical protein JSU85_01990 [Candidatus Zixiibacteriota bacterium]|nr:MAG: hypothetical protein JSU85_01990 [candidate division Zixibacteria bacterium]